MVLKGSVLINKSLNTRHLKDALVVVNCQKSNTCANWKKVHPVWKQYFKFYSTCCAKTLQTYIEKSTVNNDIRNIRVHWVEPDLCGIKVGCHFFGDTLYKSNTMQKGHTGALCISTPCFKWSLVLIDCIMWFYGYR